MADTGSMWLLRGLCGCYRVYVPLFPAKIALRGSYGTALREGVTADLIICFFEINGSYGVYVAVTKNVCPILFFRENLRALLLLYGFT